MDIQEVIQKAKEFSNSMTYKKGWYAGDRKAEFWVKCDSFEAAAQTQLKYIFFINQNDELVVYQA